MKKIIPILNLNGKQITCLLALPQMDKVLIGIEDGRILKADAIRTTAYATGDRRLYATLMDGMGCESPTVSLPLSYQLMNAIAEVSALMEVTVNKAAAPFSPSKTEEALAVFMSPVMTDPDLYFWDAIDVSSSVNTNISVFIRSANSPAKIEEAEWNYTGSGNETASLSFVSPKNTSIQVKVEIAAREVGVTPLVNSIVLTYRTAHSLMFFTESFILTKDSQPEGVLLTASYTAPVNTKIEFGVSNTLSSDWGKYTIITPDKIKALSGFSRDRLKIGAKLIAYDATNYPTIDEFAVVFKSDEETLINKV